MFGLFKKNPCFYCETEMPLLSDVCSYCGQKQKADPFASTHALGEKFKRDLRVKAVDQIKSQTTHASAMPRNAATNQRVQVPRQQSAATPTPRPQQSAATQVFQAPSLSVAAANQARRPTQTTAPKQKPASPLRLIFFLAWLGLFRDFITHYMEGRPYGALDWEFYGGGLAAALFLFFIASARSLFLSFVSALLMSGTALALLLKPKLSPHEFSWQTANGDIERYIPSYTSETHLYYVIPGLILAFLAFVIFFSTVTRTLGRIRERLS